MELELSRAELRELAAELLTRLTAAYPAASDWTDAAPGRPAAVFKTREEGGRRPLSLPGEAEPASDRTDFLSVDPDREPMEEYGEAPLFRRAAGFPAAETAETRSFSPPALRRAGAVERVNALEEMSDCLRRDSRRYDAALEQY